MVKRSSDPRSGSLTPKSNFRYGTQCELWVLLPPFASQGAGTRGKFVSSSPNEKMCTGNLCRMLQAAEHTGRARQTSGTGPCGDCRRVLWVPGPWGQYSGKIRFIEKRGVQNEGSRHVAKRSCDPRQALPELKLQGRDLRVVGIVAHFAPLGNFVLSSPRGKWAQEKCAGCQ